MSNLANQKKTEPSWVQIVQKQVSSLRFGVVQIVVHDSRVVQIECTQKVRLDRADDKTSSTVHLADS
jgi:hypothetical protein